MSVLKPVTNVLDRIALTANLRAIARRLEEQGRVGHAWTVLAIAKAVESGELDNPERTDAKPRR